MVLPKKDLQLKERKQIFSKKFLFNLINFLINYKIIKTIKENCIMKKISVIVFLFLLIFIESCTGTKTDPKTENLANGKVALSNGNYNVAVNYFNKVLAEEPHNGEALIGSSFGQFLASIVDVSDFILTMAGMNRSEGIPHGGFDIMSGSKTEKDDMLAVIYKLLGGLVEKWEDTDTTIEEAIKYGNSFKINKFPVYWGRKEIMDFSGELDKTDLYTLHIIIKSLLGTVKFVLAQELDIDIYKLYAHYINMTKKGYSLGVPLISNIIVLMLNDPELNFIGLSTQDINENGQKDGEEFYLATKTYFSDAIGSIFNAIESGTSETDNQDDDLVRVYSEENENDAEFFEENDLTGIKYVITLDKRFYYNDTTQSVYLFIDSFGYDALKRIKEQIDGATTNRVSFNNDILPVLSDIASSLLFDLNNMGLIPAQYSSYISLAKPNLLLGILQSYIPDILELDFNYFLSNPVGLRDIIPPWRNDKDDDANGFFIEWEGSNCVPNIGEPGLIATYPQVMTYPTNYYGLFTTYNDILQDIDHFDNYIYRVLYSSYNISAVKKDMMVTKTPYLAFRNNDASFNKLLYLSLENDKQTLDDNDFGFVLDNYYDTGENKDFQPATSRDLNTVIAYFYNEVESLLGK